MSTHALIPIMTSNTTPSGVAASSSAFSTAFEAFHAFDGVAASLATMQGGWLCALTDAAPTLSYQFADEYKFEYITIQTANNGPTYSVLCYIEGYNGSTWENCLQTGENVTLDFTLGSYENYNISLNGGTYSAIRLRGTETWFKGLNNTACTLSEVQLFGDVPDINAYTVVFDANGGTGTMQDQVIQMDTPTALSRNLFSRAGYVFTGWADTPNGAVHYTDEAIVTNLGEPDDTVTLYAVWRTGFEIDIQVNYTEPEALDKDVNTIMTLSGTLKSETSLINPVIIIQADLSSVANANYMTIPAFGRKYFITNIRSIRTGLIEISAHVDVLSTYADGIRANTGITRRQANEWNLYLNDGSLRMYQDQMVQTKKFPGGFDTMEFVLAVAGSSS